MLTRFYATKRRSVTSGVDQRPSKEEASVSPRDVYVDRYVDGVVTQELQHKLKVVRSDFNHMNQSVVSLLSDFSQGLNQSWAECDAALTNYEVYIADLADSHKERTENLERSLACAKKSEGDLRKEVATLQQSLEEAIIGNKDLRHEVESLEQSLDNTNEIIEINSNNDIKFHWKTGDARGSFSQTIFERNPNFCLSNWYSHWQHDENNPAEIECDTKVWRQIVEYMRNGQIPTPEQAKFGLLGQAETWCLESLVEGLEAQIPGIHEKESSPSIYLARFVFRPNIEPYPKKNTAIEQLGFTGLGENYIFMLKEEGLFLLHDGKHAKKIEVAMTVNGKRRAFERNDLSEKGTGWWFNTLGLTLRSFIGSHKSSVLLGLRTLD